MKSTYLGLGMVALLAACGGEKAGSGATVRDSSGVAIVEHDSSALARAPLFTAGAPLYSMVGTGTDSMHNANAIRSAVLVGDGRFVGLEGRANRVVLFDSAGTVLGSWGKAGTGDGAMNAPGGLRLLPDGSIQVVDFPSRVLQLSAADLSLTRESKIGPDEPVLAMLVHQTGPASAVAVATENGGAAGSSMQYLLRISRTKVDTLTSWPGGDSRELGRTAIARAWGNGIVTNGDGWNFLVRDSLGAVQRIVRVAIPARPVTPAVRDAMLARQRQQIEALPIDDQEIKAEALRGLDQKVFAESLPVFDDFLEARDGSLWVGEYTLSGETDRFYSLFDREGQLTRRVRLPATVRVLAADGDLVLLRWTDEQGSGHIDLVRLAAVPATPAS